MNGPPSGFRGGGGGKRPSQGPGGRRPRLRPAAAHAGICVTRPRVGGSRSGGWSKSGISQRDSARGVEAAEAGGGGGGGGARGEGAGWGAGGGRGGGGAGWGEGRGGRARRGRRRRLSRLNRPRARVGSRRRRRRRGRASAVGAGGREGATGPSRRGGVGRARPPPSLPPMGAGASRPPQPTEETEPGAVTSELALRRPLGRARQDRCSSWPSTYQLVRRVRNASVLGRTRGGGVPGPRRHLGGGRPRQRAPRGRRRKERAASGSCGRFPERIGAQGQREEGEPGGGADLCVLPPESRRCGVHSSDLALAAARGAERSWVVRGGSARQPRSFAASFRRGRVFLLVCLL